MDKNLLVKRIAQITGWIFVLIGVILAFVFYHKVSNDSNLDGTVLTMFNLTYVIAILAVLFAFVIGPILSILTNPKSLTKALISIGVLVVVFLVAYGMASPDTTGINPGVDIKDLSKTVLWTNTGLISMYIMAILAVLAVIAAEVRTLLK